MEFKVASLTAIQCSIIYEFEWNLFKCFKTIHKLVSIYIYSCKRIEFKVTES